MTGILYPKVKRPEREADHLTVSDADFKNAWNYTSIPLCDIMTRWLIKHRGKTQTNIMVG